MRLNLRARSPVYLLDFLASNGHAPTAKIASRTAYGDLAHSGLSVFDMPQKIYEKARDEWQPLLDALKKA